MKLPKLSKDENGLYRLLGEIAVADPMDISKNNTYWPDLKKLQPSGIRISLSDQDEALNELFLKEYSRFDFASENQSDHIMGRRILYIIDRAVFIMYLRQ
ncbi:MAG: hypothetical protein LBM69_01085, partial [Lachnospiraceae bacterium]|nr:hypothetical protein [Lachnospiraceae bacterium]